MLRSLVGSEMCIRDRHESCRAWSRSSKAKIEMLASNNEIILESDVAIFVPKGHVPIESNSPSPVKHQSSQESEHVSKMEECIIKTAITAATELAMITIEDEHIRQGVSNVGVLCGQRLIELVRSWPIFQFDPMLLETAQRASAIHSLVLGLLQGALDKPQDRPECIVLTDNDVLTLSPCLLYTSDAADEEDSVDLGGRRIIKKKKKNEIYI
eukprot:TRINITY_DN26810_c0_g1_i1.p1 TRINITY_DN26810_c0_g1~~TRINITY_DN26810_c0_g1_i1.p1  ORF type:complete len:212 (+),score=24.88 TRINITY_DN26810_c0_g1_i1:104-739(+)